MLGFLSSPRRRRQTAWTAALVGVALAVAGLIVFVPNTGESLETPVETGAVETETAPQAPPLRVTPAVRREVGVTVERFARTAVVRRRLDDAWTLASPTMRSGITREQWRRGELPVQPYPARAFGGVDWRIVEPYPRGLLLDVTVHPRRGSGGAVAVYSVELSQRAGRFLVDSWVPLTTLGADPGSGGRGRGERGAEPAPLAFDDAKLGPEWFLVPAGILAAVVLALAALAVRGVLARRRAERRYREMFQR